MSKWPSVDTEPVTNPEPDWRTLVDPISFVQAHKILFDRFGATGAELAMWIDQQDLSAWRTPKWEFHFNEAEKPANADAAAQMLITLKVQLSRPEVEAFVPPERYLNYKAVLMRIQKTAAPADVDGIRAEWERIHLQIIGPEAEKGTPYGGGYVGQDEMIAAVVPGRGYARNMEDGLFFESEIEKFLNPRQRLPGEVFLTTVPSAAHGGWELNKSEGDAFRGYGKALHLTLKAAFDKGQERPPRPTDIVDEWSRKPVHPITSVDYGLVSYENANGDVVLISETRGGTLDALRKAIGRHTKKPDTSRTLGPLRGR